MYIKPIYSYFTLIIIVGLVTIDAALAAETMRGVELQKSITPQRNLPQLHKLEITKNYLEQLANSRLTRPAGLTSSAHSQLTLIIQDFSTNQHSAASARWEQLLTEMGNRNKLNSVDINTLAQWVLRQTYIENTQDLRYYAEKIQFFNKLKKGVRDSISETRAAVSAFMNKQASKNNGQWPVGKKIRVKVISCLPTMFSRDARLRTSRRDFGKTEMEAYMADLERELSTVGDDAQLANIDMQSALQKQQQTMQQLSNISKLMHDTAMSVVRKTGG